MIDIDEKNDRLWVEKKLGGWGNNGIKASAVTKQAPFLSVAGVWRAKERDRRLSLSRSELASRAYFGGWTTGNWVIWLTARLTPRPGVSATLKS